jgi:hypothetical protein
MWPALTSGGTSLLVFVNSLSVVQQLAKVDGAFNKLTVFVYALFIHAGILREFSSDPVTLLTNLSLKDTGISPFSPLIISHIVRRIPFIVK